MNIVIMGGTNYVGLSLLKDLKNDKVTILSRKKISTISNHKSIVIDRKDKFKLNNIIDNINPEIIIDMICYDEYDAKIVLDIILKHQKRKLKHYLMISTFFIYNYTEIKEEFVHLDIGLIKDDYTKNKFLAETIIYNSQIFSISTIVRFPFIISFDDYTKRFQSLINNVLQKSELEVDTFVCSFISKESASKALFELTRIKPQGFIDISNKGYLSIKDIYKIIANFLNKDIKFICGTRNVYQINKNIKLDSKKSNFLEMEPIKIIITQEIKKYFI